MSPVKYLYVYIIKCSDNTYYTGISNNPERRVIEHNSGINKSCYTYSRRPVLLKFTERHSDFNLAISWEKKIKKWSRKKKEALINGNWNQQKLKLSAKMEVAIIILMKNEQCSRLRSN